MEGADPRAAAEAAVRTAYGRLVALLAAESRDLAAAEDALADAFAAALRTWPTAGAPDRPEAWLLVAARRRLGDGRKRDRVRVDAAATLALLHEERAAEAGAFPDERLRLMLVCAHPAIDASVRAPLMLQVVLGLDAARIASAFLTAPAAMGQRLVRAKTRIRDAGIGFQLPGAEALPERLEAVLAAIYAAYGAGWEDVTGADMRRRGLTAEALALVRIVCEHAPQEPEAWGLAALMLHCEARAAARRSPTGLFVPLSEQDAALWSRPMIAEAEDALRRAAALGRMGRFQLEAAIQSLHVSRAFGGRASAEDLLRLYDGLAALAPSVGAWLGRAAALAEVSGAEAALATLNALPCEGVRNHQPYWVLRSHLLRTLRRRSEAAEALEHAVGLTEDAAVRAFLLQRATAPA